MTTPNDPTSLQQATTQAYPEITKQSHEHQPYAPQSGQTPAAIRQPTTLGYTNTFALLAMLFAFIAPLAGIIFGHIALRQIKRNGDAGRGIGLTGLILSYAAIAVILLFAIFSIGMLIMIFGEMGSEFSDMNFDTSDI